MNAMNESLETLDETAESCAMNSMTLSMNVKVQDWLSVSSIICSLAGIVSVFAAIYLETLPWCAQFFVAGLLHRPVS
jgi:hypothetical protein